MFHVYTFFGTVIFLDESSMLLRHGRLDDVPRNVVIEVSEKTATLFWVREAELHPIGDLGPSGCRYVANDPAASSLDVVLKDLDQAAFRYNGRYLTAEVDGSVTLHRQISAAWERFRFMSAHQVDELMFIQSHAWIQADPSHLIRPSDIAPGHGFVLRMGTFDVPLANLLELVDGPPLSRPSNKLEMTIIIDCWRIIVLRLYRPLIYLVAYGDVAIFDCATMAIDSLLSSGRWTGDIMLITDRAHLGFSTPGSEGTGRLKVVALAADDTLDFALARYKIGEIDQAHHHQPIIYVDTDVICNAPLDGLIRMLCFSNELHALLEYKLLTAENYYGRSLFAIDPGSETDEDRGFSTGILAFRKVSQVEEPFRLIVSLAYSIQEIVQNRNIFSYFDQPVANYVKRRTSLALGDLAPWARGSVHLDEPDVSPTSRVGLIHFYGFVGCATPKRERMRKYLSAIEQVTGEVV